MKKGDWVSDVNRGADAPQVGKVRDMWTDDLGTCINVALYDYEGKCVGRRSPACGGPRAFEPALTASDWCVIEKPKFPLKNGFFTRENGSLGFGTRPTILALRMK